MVSFGGIWEMRKMLRVEVRVYSTKIGALTVKLGDLKFEI